MPKAIDEAKVFEVAAALFVERGYERTKTKDIAAQAGVNEATLFRRYGNKAALISRSIDRQWRDVPFAELRASEDLEGDLVAIVEAYLETNRTRGAMLSALLSELARSSELRGAFDGGLRNIGALVAIVQHHQAAGRMRSEDPMITTTALIGPLLVQAMFRRAGVGAPGTLDARDYVRAFLEGRAG